MIYTETISILYESNVLDFNHLDTIMYLQKSILPQRWSQIGALQLSWRFKGMYDPPPYNLRSWDEICSALASCTGLRELTLRLDHMIKFDIKSSSTPTGGRWMPWLKALTKIRAPKKFDVFLDWTADECAEAATSLGSKCPFRLLPEETIRPPEDPDDDEQAENATTSHGIGE